MFDRFVAQGRPEWARRALAFASLAVHGGAGAVLLVWSVFHVEEVAPPVLAITFYAAPQPPPPPPPAGGPRNLPRHPPTRTVAATHPLLQPVPIAPQPITAPTPDPPTDEHANDPLGVGPPDGPGTGPGGGGPGGIPGGNGDTPGSLTPAARPQPPVRRISSLVFDRQRVTYPDPHLPQPFVQAHAGQRVHGMYLICVRTDGRVASVTTLAGIPGADDAVAEQLRASWSYRPQPVPLCTPRVFDFIIN